MIVLRLLGFKEYTVESAIKHLIILEQMYVQDSH